MAKLWLFLAFALAQKVSLERLLLRADGTYEAHWSATCPGNPPYEVRLPGRFTYLSASEGAPVIAFTMQPDTFWGPYSATLQNDPEIPLGLSVTATYLAGSDPEEVKGTVQAHTRDHLVISTAQATHWISRQHLLSLSCEAQDGGASPYPATRLKIFPQNTTIDPTFSLFTRGKLSDSLRFFYFLAPEEGDVYRLTAWVRIPPLWGQVYEANLEVQAQDNLTWSVGRFRWPTHAAFQVRLAQYVFRGREAYLFSLPARPFPADSGLMGVEAQSILYVSSEEAPPLPPGESSVRLRGGTSISFSGGFGPSMRIPYPSSARLRATLHEAPQKSDRKAAPTIVGTLRVTNPFSEPIHLLVEKPVPVDFVLLETGLARVERREALYLLLWEAILAPGQSISFSYRYAKP